ncbi:unannotated protein [freshwater metagenome]|jgi:branched-subunit amino acid ABC-type transport system permease component|uniref:Unannotated protein n=1 Tax=freshwater metagenome TaxID=449393 RepID=A0A6J6EXN5_9ZZZZ
MGAVRRSLAGLLFGIAFAFACLTVSGYLLQRSAFTPDRAADAAATVLQDEEVQRLAISVVADATADQMYPGDPTGSAIIRQNITLVASLPLGAEVYAPVLADVHSVLIGERDGPVVVEPEQLVLITRDERAATLPPLSIEVPRLGVLAAVDGVLGWLVPISAIVALVFVVLTFLARPERAPLLRTLGIGLVALAALAIVFSYVIPKFLPPVLDESPWARVPARMADDSLGLTLFASFVLAAAGLVLFLASTRMGRTKRWSTPVSTYRYREERSWS